MADKLQRLGNRIPTLNPLRVAVLEAKAGSTPRIRGDAWMKIRRTALLAGWFRCVDCGHVSPDNEVDHDTPLEQGGSNEQSNLRIRCHACHAEKSKHETRIRYGRG